MSTVANLMKKLDDGSVFYEERGNHRVIRESVLIAATEKIERLEAACQLVRKNMNTQRNGSSGWMCEFEKLAFKE